MMALILVFRNISKLAPTSDYRYQVLVGDGTPERSTVLEVGLVRGHVRDDGWEALLNQFVADRDVEFSAAKRAKQERSYG